MKKDIGIIAVKLLCKIRDHAVAIAQVIQELSINY
jgi:hypothetical protein